MSIPNIFDISEKEILALQDNSFVVIDVRTPQEYEEDHLNTAIHIPLDDLPKKLSSIPQDKTVLLYCRSGNRAQQASKYLNDNNYQTFNIGSFFHLSDAVLKKLDPKE